MDKSDLVHIMMDLETMGTVPGCAVLSIGCVVMNLQTLELGDTFYSVVSLPDCLDKFLEEDPSTKEWWDGRDAAARQVLHDANDPAAPLLVEALEELNRWFASVGASVQKARLYGNGADFDNPILRVAYSAANVLPFGAKKGFFGGRCYRTLKSLDELFGPTFQAPKMDRQGTYHNALDDAKSQALHLLEFVRSIRFMLENEGVKS